MSNTNPIINGPQNTTYKRHWATRTLLKSERTRVFRKSKQFLIQCYCLWFDLAEYTYLTIFQTRGEHAQYCTSCVIDIIFHYILDAVIDKTNCINNTTWAVNTRQSTVEFTAVFSSSILSKNCLVYVSNDDFQAKKVYEVLVEMSGNFSMHHDFSAGIFVGHPDSNQPIQVHIAQSRLPRASPLFSSNLYWKVEYFLSCHR